jgi:hypothetical protein
MEETEECQDDYGDDEGEEDEDRVAEVNHSTILWKVEFG